MRILSVRRGVLLVLTAGYPLTAHVAVIMQRPDIGLAVLVVLVVAHVVARASEKIDAYLWAVTLGALGALAAIALSWGPTQALFLPPVLISGFLFVIFASSLLPGRESLVTQIARFDRDDLSSELADYTRRVTWVWCGFLAVMTLESILLAAYARLEIWSLFTNIINYLLIAALFISEHIYRSVRFRRSGRTSLQRLLLQIIQQGVRPTG